MRKVYVLVCLLTLVTASAWTREIPNSCRGKCADVPLDRPTSREYCQQLVSTNNPNPVDLQWCKDTYKATVIAAISTPNPIEGIESATAADWDCATSSRGCVIPPGFDSIAFELPFEMWGVGDDATDCANALKAACAAGGHGGLKKMTFDAGTQTCSGSCDDDSGVSAVQVN